MGGPLAGRSLEVPVQATGLQILRSNADMLRDAGKHSRADLLAVVERENEIWLTFARERVR
jgi:predicted TIM-barrel enzyme